MYQPRPQGLLPLVGGTTEKKPLEPLVKVPGTPINAGPLIGQRQCQSNGLLRDVTRLAPPPSRDLLETLAGITFVPPL